MSAVLDTPLRAVPDRQPTRRRYLMCPPRYFALEYAINPWMDPSQPVDVDLAMALSRVAMLGAGGAALAEGAAALRRAGVAAAGAGRDRWWWGR